VKRDRVLSTTNTIPYGRQLVEEDDIQAVVDVLRSDYITQGPVVPEFEAQVAKYCGANFAIAANSATSALHIACLALGVGEGDWVWTSPNTFVASANCALYCGAKIDFVDIDPYSYNISTKALAVKLDIAERDGRLPKVVIPVHMCGNPCDMFEIHSLAKRYGFKVIEDASHAIGARYLDNPVGRCDYSDITVFSFHPVKIITSGEGGMALTNDPEIAQRLKRFRSHGITSNPSDMIERPSDELWYYQQLDLGFNYRMTDIHAALGLSQLSKVDRFVEDRRTVASRYQSMLAALPITLPTESVLGRSSYHLYVVRLNRGQLKVSQREVFSCLHSAGIGVNLHYIPVYRQPYYERLGFSSGYCQEAEKYFTDAVSLPIYPSLTETQQTLVVSVFRECLCC